VVFSHDEDKVRASVVVVALAAAALAGADAVLVGSPIHFSCTLHARHPLLGRRRLWFVVSTPLTANHPLLYSLAPRSMSGISRRCWSGSPSRQAMGWRRSRLGWRRNPTPRPRRRRQGWGLARVVGERRGPRRTGSLRGGCEQRWWRGAVVGGASRRTYMVVRNEENGWVERGLEEPCGVV